MKKLMLILNLFFIINFVNAQSVSVTGPGKLDCPPVTATYTFDVDEQWCTSFMTGEVTLGTTSTNGTTYQTLPLNGPAGQFNTGGSFDLDVTFTQSGVYYLCIEVTFVSTSIWCGAPIFGGGNSVKVRKACKRIVVGDSQTTPNGGTRRYCDGELFHWCPGDFGVQSLSIPPSVGAFATPDPLTGCITFVVRGGDERDEVVVIATITKETCNGVQTGFITFIFGGCDGDMEFDDPTVKGRSHMASKDILERITIYPNPASGLVNIMGLEGEFDIDIISISGQLMQSKKAVVESDQVNISDLPSGSYIIMIHTENGLVQKKLQKI